MLLNINTYYFTSSIYKELEQELIANNNKFLTYVPVISNYYCRKECEGDLNKGVVVSKCISKYDRIFFKLKHSKIFIDLENKVDLNNISIIHAHSLFSNGYIALKIYEKYNIPYIVTVQNTDLNIFFKKMPHLRKIGIKILLNADKIIFFSKTYKDEMISKFISIDYKKDIEFKSEIIPPGLPNYWIENKNLNKVKNKKQINLLYVGNIDKNKNITSVIRACKKLRREDIDIQYTIVGNVNNKKLKKQLEKTEFIKYIPYVERKNLSEIYRKNDIFIMTSIKESFGLVYLEAISQAMPVIYSKGQGFDKQFEEGIVGYSVRSKNIVEIMESIKKIYLNYENISNNCIKNIDKFRWNNIYKKYFTIYEQIKVREVEYDN